MRSKIRTKLFTAFLVLLLPLLILIVISHYNQKVIYRAIHRVEIISEEMLMVHRLQLAIDRALMIGKNYIITGKKTYVGKYKRLTMDVETLLKETESSLRRVEELQSKVEEVEKEEKILKDVKTAWQNIREISFKIFAIPDPVGNSAASRLMEDIDYRWGSHAIEGLKRWQEIDMEEYKEAVETSDRAWKRSWITMITGSFILCVLCVYFSFFYSNRFAKPIVIIHEMADAIAKGYFKERVAVKTGDEIEGLGNAMNEMAIRLDSFYINLENTVTEKTKELTETTETLQKSEARNRAFLYAIPDMMFRISKDGIFLDFKAQEGDLYLSPSTFLGKKLSEVLPYEVGQQAMHFMQQALRTGLMQTFEYQLPMPGGIRDYEARIVTGAEEEALIIVRNITEHKQVDVAIRRSKEEWEATVDAISDPLFIHDEQFRIVRANRAYADAAGMSFNDIIGRHYFEIFPKMDGPHKMCLETLKLHKKAEEELSIPSLDKIFNVRFYPVGDGEKKWDYYVHLMEDISEKKRAEEKLKELFLGTVKSLSSAIDAKSPWTAGHSERVTKYTLYIGKEMGFSEKELKELELAGLLHDIGKIGTYEAILDKPGKLTDEELNLMRQHPTKGAEILEPINQFKNIIPGIKHHHEFYDGTGYPDGLKGDAIPLFARILTVADTVDAMSAERPYRKGKPMDAIIAELKKCAGTQFDPEVVNMFLKVVKKGGELIRKVF